MLERRIDAKSPRTYNQSCSSIQILCRHTILTVKEADAHIKADKVVHMLQLTIRSQNPSTSSHAKGPRLYRARSLKRHTCPHLHGARKQEGGASSARSEVTKGVHLPLSARSEGASEKDFVRPERSRTRIIGSAWLCKPDGP